jgi:CBS domain-containing protein
VSDYMTEDYVAVSPDTPVRDVARSMRENQIHRVLVLDDGSLCGIVSTFDLVGLIEQEG